MTLDPRLATVRRSPLLLVLGLPVSPFGRRPLVSCSELFLPSQTMLNLFPASPDDSRLEEDGTLESLLSFRKCAKVFFIVEPAVLDVMYSDFGRGF